MLKKIENFQFLWVASIEILWSPKTATKIEKSNARKHDLGKFFINLDPSGITQSIGTYRYTYNYHFSMIHIVVATDCICRVKIANVNPTLR